MDSRNIQIRLIRKDQSDPEMDDRIAIETIAEDMYNVYFKTSDLTRIYHELQLSGQELDVYIHSLLILLANDRDAFESVQFLLPGFPSILLNPKDLKKAAIGKNLQYLMPLLTSVNKVRLT